VRASSNKFAAEPQLKQLARSTEIDHGTSIRGGFWRINKIHGPYRYFLLRFWVSLWRWQGESGEIAIYWLNYGKEKATISSDCFSSVTFAWPPAAITKNCLPPG
jgi:hypothetical protein